MPLIQTDKLSTALGGLAPVLEAAADLISQQKNKENALLKEFSQLIDKISMQVNENTELEVQTPSPMQVPPIKRPTFEGKKIDKKLSLKPKNVEVVVKDKDLTAEQETTKDITDKDTKKVKPQSEIDEVVLNDSALEGHDPHVVIDTATETIEENILASNIKQIVPVAEQNKTTQVASEVIIEADVEEAAGEDVLKKFIQAGPNKPVVKKSDMPQEDKTAASPVLEDAVLEDAVLETVDSTMQKIDPVKGQQLKSLIPQYINPKDEVMQIKPESNQVIAGANTDNASLLKSLEQLISKRLIASENAAIATNDAARSALMNNLILKSQIESFMSRASNGLPNVVAGQSVTGAESMGHRSDIKSSLKAKSTDGQSAPMRETYTRQELRTLEKVEEVLKEVARSRDGKTLSFRLDPPQLGSVRIDVSLREGILHARLAADNPAVSNLLREKSAHLQQALRDLGLDVDSVSVGISDDSNFGQRNENRRHGFEVMDEDSQSESKMYGGLNSKKEAVVTLGKAVKSVIADHWVA